MLVKPKTTYEAINNSGVTIEDAVESIMQMHPEEDEIMVWHNINNHNSHYCKTGETYIYIRDELM
jgi:hypoxanthine phosphoribosyltransferase